MQQRGKGGAGAQQGGKRKRKASQLAAQVVSAEGTLHASVASSAASAASSAASNLSRKNAKLLRKAGGQGTTAINKKKQKWSFKVVFDSPYALRWPPLDEPTQREVLQRLTLEFGEYKRKANRPNRRTRLRKKRRKVSQQPQQPTEAAASGAAMEQVRKETGVVGSDPVIQPPQQQAMEEKMQIATEKSQQEEDNQSSSSSPSEAKPKKGDGEEQPKSKEKEEEEQEEQEKQKEKAKRTRRQQLLRRKVCLGINAVTKALEKGRPLRLLVVCRDVKPPRLVQHLPSMAFVNDVPLCILGGGGGEDASSPSIHLGRCFGLRTVAALAFFADDNKGKNEKQKESDATTNANDSKETKSSGRVTEEISEEEEREAREAEARLEELIKWLEGKAVKLDIPWLEGCKKAKEKVEEASSATEKKRDDDHKSTGAEVDAKLWPLQLF
ncbi:Ribonuclease P protein subunit p38 [Balamuthia mandrillaris]